MKDEARINSTGTPRHMRVPGSVEWCYQTAGLLKMFWQGMILDKKHFMEYLTELRTYKAWTKIPAHAPYGSEAEMLKQEIGFEGNIEKAVDTRELKEKVWMRQGKEWGKEHAAGKSLRQIADDAGFGKTTVRRRIKWYEDQPSQNECIDTKNGTPKKREMVQVNISQHTTPETAAAKLREKFGDEWVAKLRAAL